MQLKDLLKLPPERHYYGDLVRALFLLVGIIMLITLPLFKEIIPFPFYISIFSIILINVFAGLTNPNQLIVILLDNLISLSGLVVFEFFAIKSILNNSSNLFYLVNQLLAVVLFFALYYSIKSLRGFLIKEGR